MMGFGDVMIDAIGRIRETPSISAVSGLLANALGIRREEYARLARLQERLVVGCRVDHVDSQFTDFQTAQLGGADRWWTTSGRPQERAGGTATFDSPHIRWRDYDSDARLTIAIRLLDETEPPTLDELAEAVQWPARPLFFGRKCCLPSAPLYGGIVEGDTAYEVLRHLPLRSAGRSIRRAPADALKGIVLTLPPEEPCPAGFESITSTEQRDWPAGVHAGLQRRFRAVVGREVFAMESHE